MTDTVTHCPVCGNDRFSDFMKVKDHFLTHEEFRIQQCDGCGFRFVNPRPGKDAIGSYYQSADYISHDAGSGSLLSRIYRIARNVSVRGKYILVSKFATAGELLDIGCGTGEFLKYCSSRGFCATGVEPNEKARNYAKETNGIAVADDLKTITAKKDFFDVVTLWHVLEHMHDPAETLALVRDLLKPEGVLIIAVPNSYSWDARKYGKFWAAYDVPRHLLHFTETTLRKLVTSCGFEFREMVPQKMDSFYVSLLSEKYKTGRQNLVKAFFSGLKSNLEARRPGTGYSSQIFIFSVKKR